MNGEIMHFLLPSLDSGLELTFFILILGGLLASLISAEMLGRETNWERNWNGTVQTGALDPQHGSISELSHALASLPERIVGNMPGLLLIFGLLGTFLGLGLALDKASMVLQGSGDSIGAMSDSLGQLTGMMKDLGSKFKTSTWGIMAFIALKLWEASRWSAESRRSAWCVRQMKLDMELERRGRRAYDERRDLQARESLEVLGERLVQGMHQQSSQLAEDLRALMALQVQLARDSQDQTQDFHKKSLAQATTGNRLLGQLEQSAASVAQRLETIQSRQADADRHAASRHAETQQQLADLAAQHRESNQTLLALHQQAGNHAAQFDDLKRFNARLLSLAQERDDHLLEQVTEFINQIRESNLSLASLDQRSESVARQLDGLLQGTRDINQRLDALNASSISQESHLESTLEGLAGVNESLNAATDSAVQLFRQLGAPAPRKPQEQSAARHSG